MTILKANHITIKISTKLICHELSLSVSTGDRWCILGPNGVGKTTLLHTLRGLYRAASGELLLNDKSLSHWQSEKLAQTLGILFQEFNAAFPQSVWQYCLMSRYPHLSFFKKERAVDIDMTFAALKRMELVHLMKRTLNQLSGGEKRRLAIACLLTQDPDIYLLDEPTNHLDLRHQIQMLDHFVFLTEQKNKAIIMASHDIHLAKVYSNRVLLLFADGEARQGSPEEMLTIQHLSQLYQMNEEMTKRYFDEKGMSHGNQGIS